MYAYICMYMGVCTTYMHVCFPLLHDQYIGHAIRRATECVLLLQSVFSYYRMCSLTIECVLLLQNVSSSYRMCSLTTECVLLLQNVFSYYMMRSRPIECVLFL